MSLHEVWQSIRDIVRRANAFHRRKKVISQLMPWCDHCQCWHHKTADHIRKESTS